MGNHSLMVLFQNNVGTLPTSILVLNDQDALVNFIPGTMVFEMDQTIHGPARYRDLDITTKMEREEVRMQQDDLEQEHEELEA